MRAKLDFGAEIDLFNKDEFDSGLREFEHRWMERSRIQEAGKKHLNLPIMRGTADNNGGITIGSTETPDQVPVGPREGFVWQVVRLSVGVMGSSETIALYKGEVGNDRFVAVINGGSGGGLWSSSHGLLLHPGDHLVLATRQLAGGLAANKAYSVTGEVYQTPAEMVGKLFGAS